MTGAATARMTLADTLERLEEALADGSAIDAYLLAAAAGQIADDFAARLAWPLEAAVGVLADSPPAARAVELAATAARAVARRRRPAVQHWRAELEHLLGTLAEAALAPEPAIPSNLGLEKTSLPRALLAEISRPPACFANLDQRPADVAELARRFAARRPQRDRPFLVVGVRTSGSYLAPLCRAALRRLGCSRTEAITLRPEHPLRATERRTLRTLARAGGTAIVIDDPPVTGGSIAAVARRLERAGLPAEGVVVLVPILGDGPAPRMLGRYQTVTLPEAEWSVQRDLEPGAVSRALAALQGGPEPALEPLPLPAGRARGHQRRLYRVAGTNRRVLVEGVGLGHLGAHRLATPRLLREFSCPVHGLRDGLLYREWLPGRARAGVDDPALVETVARYAALRRRELPVTEDLAARLRGERPAWEVAGIALSRSFGRGGAIARPLLTDRVARRLLRVREPSLTDGNTGPGQWFRAPDGGARLVKVDLGEDRYSNLTPPCYDAAFDLVGASAEGATVAVTRGLRSRFAAHTGEQVEPERWLLYELTHLWGRERTQPERAGELRRARSRALQRYYAETYLAGLEPGGAGPLVALDLDGVLESGQFGFPAPTPASALALRALLAHGYRPVLASGRSLDEVVERCRAYGLAGGVAEYGSAVYLTAGDRVRVLADARSTAALEQLRTGLAGAEGIRVDGDYRLAVRAYSVAGGRRRALDPPSLPSLPMRTIVGDDQTDFVPAGVDKGRALRLLAASLGVEGARPFALAVGDTASDLPMADVAQAAWAPAHARTALRGSGFQLTGRPYQSGLAEAVGRLLGHSPGGCEACRLPPGSPARDLLGRVLALQERGTTGIVGNALALAWRLR